MSEEYQYSKHSHYNIHMWVTPKTHLIDLCLIQRYETTKELLMLVTRQIWKKNKGHRHLKEAAKLVDVSVWSGQEYWLRGVWGTLWENCGCVRGRMWSGTAVVLCALWMMCWSGTGTETHVLGRKSKLSRNSKGLWEMKNVFRLAGIGKVQLQLNLASSLGYRDGFVVNIKITGSFYLM